MPYSQGVFPTPRLWYLKPHCRGLERGGDHSACSSHYGGRSCLRFTWSSPQPCKSVSLSPPHGRGAQGSACLDQLPRGMSRTETQARVELTPRSAPPAPLVGFHTAAR